MYECKKEQVLREEDISKGWGIFCGYILKMFKSYDM